MQNYKIISLIAIFYTIVAIIGIDFAYNKGYDNADNECIANNASTIIKQQQKANQLSNVIAVAQESAIVHTKILYKTVYKYKTESCITFDRLKDFRNEIIK